MHRHLVSVVSQGVVTVLMDVLLVESLGLRVNLGENWIRASGLLDHCLLSDWHSSDWDCCDILGMLMDWDVVVLSLLCMVVSNRWMVLLVVLLVGWVSNSMWSHSEGLWSVDIELRVVRVLDVLWAMVVNWLWLELKLHRHSDCVWLVDWSWGSHLMVDAVHWHGGNWMACGWYSLVDRMINDLHWLSMDMGCVWLCLVLMVV